MPVSMLDPRLIRPVAEERRPVREQWVGERGHGQHPAREHEGERRRIAPALCVRGSGSEHESDQENYVSQRRSNSSEIDAPAAALGQ